MQEQRENQTSKRNKLTASDSIETGHIGQGFQVSHCIKTKKQKTKTHYTEFPFKTNIMGKLFILRAASAPSRFLLSKTVIHWGSFLYSSVCLLAVLGPHCFVRAFSSCSEQGLTLSGCTTSHCGGVSYCGPRALGCLGFSRFGPWAQELWLPGSRAQTQQL